MWTLWRFVFSTPKFTQNEAMGIGGKMRNKSEMMKTGFRRERMPIREGRGL
jgi:hypothetical protein